MLFSKTHSGPLSFVITPLSFLLPCVREKYTMSDPTTRAGRLLQLHGTSGRTEDVLSVSTHREKTYLGFPTRHCLSHYAVCFVDRRLSFYRVTDLLHPELYFKTLKTWIHPMQGNWHAAWVKTYSVTQNSIQSSMKYVKTSSLLSRLHLHSACRSGSFYA